MVAEQDQSMVKNSFQKPEEEKNLLNEDKSQVINGTTPIDQQHSESIQAERAKLPPKHSELEEWVADLPY